MEITGLSPLTPWTVPGARWHVHLPPADDLAAVHRAAAPILSRHSDRFQVLPLDRLHCTLVWTRERPATLARRLCIDESELAADLRERVQANLRFEAPADPVPVTGLRWAGAGPVLTVDADAAAPLWRAASSAVRLVADSHFVAGPAGGDLHIALAYATTEWSADEVAALDAELRAAVEGELLDVAIRPALLLCLQDTFAAGGLDWTDEVRLTQ